VLRAGAAELSKFVIYAKICQENRTWSGAIFLGIVGAEGDMLPHCIQAVFARNKGNPTFTGHKLVDFIKEPAGSMNSGQNRNEKL